MNELVVDIETTGLPPKGGQYFKDYMKYPYPVSISWLYKGVMKDFIINQEGREVPARATEVHGITTEMANASPHELKNVLNDLMVDAKNADIIVGHNIYFDISIMKASLLRILKSAPFDRDQKNAYYEVFQNALNKNKRIDTMMKTVKFCKIPFKSGRGGYKWPTLIELYKVLFDEEFDAHKSKDDVEATHRCFIELVKREVITI